MGLARESGDSLELPHIHPKSFGSLICHDATGTNCVWLMVAELWTMLSFCDAKMENPQDYRIIFLV